MRDPIKKPNSTNIRAYPDIRDKLNDWSLKLSAIEGKTVKVPEVVKRITNIPLVPIALEEDARIKRDRRTNGFQ